MSGYDGYSMSNRARQAYADGKMPLSKIKKKDLEDAGIDVSLAEFKKAAKAGIIQPSEWHHTSKRYNQTDFYDLESISELIEDGDLDIRKELRESSADCEFTPYISRSGKITGICNMCGQNRDHDFHSRRPRYNRAPRTSMGKTRRGGF